MAAPSEYAGNRGPASGSSRGNELQFVIASLLSGVRTTYPVRVESVTNDGGVSPIGRVSITVLVSQMDGEGNVIPHAVIHNVPYIRIQGGSNAVILDPEVGDIGKASFCAQDISAVKAAGKESPPGSKRRHHFADAIYDGTIIGAAPTQYVRFSSDGIEMVSPIKIRTVAPVLEHVGDFLVTGDSSFIGAMTNNSINIGSTHTHGNVQNGPDITGSPV